LFEGLSSVLWGPRSVLFEEVADEEAAALRVGIDAERKENER
jgi:hypothetical protein